MAPKCGAPGVAVGGSHAGGVQLDRRPSCAPTPDPPLAVQWAWYSGRDDHGSREGGLDPSAAEQAAELGLLGPCWTGVAPTAMDWRDSPTPPSKPCSASATDAVTLTPAYVGRWSVHPGGILQDRRLYGVQVVPYSGVGPPPLSRSDHLDAPCCIGVHPRSDC